MVVDNPWGAWEYVSLNEHGVLEFAFYSDFYIAKGYTHCPPCVYGC